MQILKLRLLAAAMIPLSICGPIEAQDEGSVTQLRVATREAPPFAMQRPDGSWHGLSIDLWSNIARELDLDFTLESMGIDEMVEAVANGEMDAAVAALTMTAEREARVDFTHPFHVSGLAIAVPVQRGGLWVGLVRALFSPAFVQAFGALVLLLAGVGAAIWLLERRHNPDQFGGSNVSGLGSGFWWAAVTMTTVGYGDKSPVSPAGRVLGILWMFIGVVTISGFTAAIASALTAHRLTGDIRGPEDLPGRRVAVVAQSAAEAALDRRGIRSRGVETLEEGLAQLSAGRFDAVVYDAPLLSYQVAVNHDGVLSVLPGTFERQAYAIALPQGSPHREAINRALLAKVTDPSWVATLTRHLNARSQ